MPLNKWLQGPLKDYYSDIKNTAVSKLAHIFNISEFKKTQNEDEFSRQAWSIISLHYFYENLCKVKNVKIEFSEKI